MGHKPISWLEKIISPIKECVGNNSKKQINVIDKKFSDGGKYKEFVEENRKLTYAECVAKGLGCKKMMT